LAIALVAVLVGILFLYLELNLYEFKLEGAPTVGCSSGGAVVSSPIQVPSASGLFSAGC